jgi:hypothetical protein
VLTLEAWEGAENWTGLVNDLNVAPVSPGGLTLLFP